jgi:hypothetical protein
MAFIIPSALKFEHLGNTEVVEGRIVCGSKARKGRHLIAASVRASLGNLRLSLEARQGRHLHFTTTKKKRIRLRHVVVFSFQKQNDCPKSSVAFMAPRSDKVMHKRHPHEHRCEIPSFRARHVPFSIRPRIPHRPLVPRTCATHAAATLLLLPSGKSLVLVLLTSGL